MGVAEMTMTPIVEEKFSLLKRLLSTYPKTAVAFSGGVDSTLLLHTALAVLGASQVVAFHLRSPLQSERAERQCQEVLEKNFPATLRCVPVELSPLDWPEFTANDRGRCYLCKMRMFTAILEAMVSEECCVLADGTNGDDIHQPRPGLQAIAELAVKSPLAEVRLSKGEIRQLARSCGLSNFAQPSNSCLATRVSTGLPITRNHLGVIEQAEEFLEELGFCGCRVRMHSVYFQVEVAEEDMDAFTKPEVRHKVQRHFAAILPLPAMLSLIGR